MNTYFLYHLILTTLYEGGFINTILQMKHFTCVEKLKNLPKFTHHVSPYSSLYIMQLQVYL